MDDWEAFESDAKALNDDGDALKRAKAKGDEEALNDDPKVCKGGKEALKGEADALNGDRKALKRR